MNSTLTPGQFIGPGGATQYFIEITSGPFAGLTDDIVTNDATSVTTANDDSSEVAATETFKIYPHWTLNTAFGPPANSGLNGSNTLGECGQRACLESSELNRLPNTGTAQRVPPQAGAMPTARRLIAEQTSFILIRALWFSEISRERRQPNWLAAVKLGPTIVPGVASGLTYARNGLCHQLYAEQLAVVHGRYPALVSTVPTRWRMRTMCLFGIP